MPDIEKYEINHKAFIILGLISETPNGSHAYSINQRIEGRGMRNWTNIGKSSIYNIISKLEENGLVESYNEEVDNRTRRVYTITDDGSQILKRKIITVLTQFMGRNDKDFYVAFSMLPYLSEEEGINAFENSIKSINDHLTELKSMLEENKLYPLNVRGLFIHPILILETDLEFLGWAIRKIRKYGIIKNE